MRNIIMTIIILFVSSPAYAQGVKPFLKKMFDGVPDNYGVKIIYVTGSEETFELASHTLTKETGTFEFVTKDDVWHWVPLSNVQRIEFDKRFSKIIDIREKELMKQTDKSGSQ